jgi:hypothetical protein
MNAPSWPQSPLHLQFSNSKTLWPSNIESPVRDKYSAIRGAGDHGRAILGMSFLSTLKGVIFDFTKGSERVGFIPRMSIEVTESSSVVRRIRDWVRF